MKVCTSVGTFRPARPLGADDTLCSTICAFSRWCDSFQGLGWVACPSVRHRPTGIRLLLPLASRRDRSNALTASTFHEEWVGEGRELILSISPLCRIGFPVEEP